MYDHVRRHCTITCGGAHHVHEAPDATCGGASVRDAPGHAYGLAVPLGEAGGAEGLLGERRPEDDVILAAVDEHLRARASAGRAFAALRARARARVGGRGACRKRRQKPAKGERQGRLPRATAKTATDWNEGGRGGTERTRAAAAMRSTEGGSFGAVRCGHLVVLQQRHEHVGDAHHPIAQQLRLDGAVGRRVLPREASRRAAQSAQATPRALKPLVTPRAFAALVPPQPSRTLGERPTLGAFAQPSLWSTGRYWQAQASGQASRPTSGQQQRLRTDRQNRRFQGASGR